jgi:TrmH family RNA methyltransferase
MATPPRITSRQNPRVKNAVRLRSRRERQRVERFLIDGAREIERALRAGIRCVEAFVCQELCGSAECREAVEALRRADVELLSVSTGVYGKLAFGEREEGVVAVAEAPRRQWADLQLGAQPIVAVLEGLEKPGNVGAILRSADAADVDAVILADARSDLYNPNTIRASLGTVFRSNVLEARTAEAMEWLSSRKLPIIAARPDAKTLYTEVDLRNGAAIVLGSEADGLTDAWQGPHVTAVRLPMLGMADSLNVSTTAAILFYEALRQRGIRR